MYYRRFVHNRAFLRNSRFHIGASIVGITLNYNIGGRQDREAHPVRTPCRLTAMSDQPEEEKPAGPVVAFAARKKDRGHLRSKRPDPGGAGQASMRL